jgi:hypothetical protein
VFVVRTRVLSAQRMHGLDAVVCGEHLCTHGANSIIGKHAVTVIE